MKITIIFVLFFSSVLGKEFSWDVIENNSSVIHYSLNYGQLGDRLFGYVGARWIAYKNDLAFCCPRFDFYDELKLVDNEFFIKKIPLKNKKYHFKPLSRLDYRLEKYKTIYDVHYRTVNKFLTHNLFQQMRNDKEFMKIIKSSIYPKGNLDLIFPPKDRISVAVHIRKDKKPLTSVQIFQKLTRKSYDQTHCLKFPPEQYYIDQIKNLSLLLDHQPIYLFIFTDYSHPQRLLKRIQKEVDLDNVVFDCRDTFVSNPLLQANQDKKTILSDFFSMLNFDCMIRSGDSNFSKLIHFIGDHKIVIYPKNYHWEEDEIGRKYLIMDDIEIENNL